jgi:hypothetical protein
VATICYEHLVLTGTQVSKLYEGPFLFDGKLEKVTITLAD